VGHGLRREPVPHPAIPPSSSRRRSQLSIRPGAGTHRIRLRRPLLGVRHSDPLVSRTNDFFNLFNALWPSSDRRSKRIETFGFFLVFFWFFFQFNSGFMYEVSKPGPLIVQMGMFGRDLSFGPHRWHGLRRRLTSPALWSSLQLQGLLPGRSDSAHSAQALSSQRWKSP
jgi:hypothetical protein